MQSCSPVLPLGSWQPATDHSALLSQFVTRTRVRAVMLYPDPHSNDEAVAQRNALLFTQLVQLTARYEDAGADEVATYLKQNLLFIEDGNFSAWKQLLLLLEENLSAIRRHSIKEEFRLAGRRAAMAGDLLLYILRLEKHGFGGSYNRASKILQRIYADSTTPGGTSVPHSRETINKAWSTYKPVAHLWAAWRVVTDAFFHEQGIPPTSTGFCTEAFTEDQNRWFGNDFPSFLALAELFREFGVSHISVRLRDPRPTLPPDETWSCRGHIPLPAIQQVIPPLTGREQAILNSR